MKSKPLSEKEKKKVDKRLTEEPKSLYYINEFGQKKKWPEYENKKQCSRCEGIKDYSEFNRDRMRKDGYKGICRVCTKELNKKYTHNNAKKESRKRWLKNNLLKIKAKRIIRKLIKEEKIKKENCFFCGDPTTEIHHLLYEFPLKIIWVCEKHRIQLLPNHYLMSKKRQIAQNDLIIELKNKVNIL